MSKISDETIKFFIELQMFVLGATFHWDTVCTIPCCTIS